MPRPPNWEEQQPNINTDTNNNEYGNHGYYPNTGPQWVMPVLESSDDDDSSDSESESDSGSAKRSRYLPHSSSEDEETLVYLLYGDCNNAK